MNPKTITKFATKDLVYELLARVERAEQIEAKLLAALAPSSQQRKAATLARATMEPATRKVIDTLNQRRKKTRMEPGTLREPILAVTRTVALKVAEIQKELKGKGHAVSEHQVHAQLRRLMADGELKRTGKAKSYRYKAA